MNECFVKPARCFMKLMFALPSGQRLFGASFRREETEWMAIALALDLVLLGFTWLKQLTVVSAGVPTSSCTSTQYLSTYHSAVCTIVSSIQYTQYCDTV